MAEPMVVVPRSARYAHCPVQPPPIALLWQASSARLIAIRRRSVSQAAIDQPAPSRRLLHRRSDRRRPTDLGVGEWEWAVGRGGLHDSAIGAPIPLRQRSDRSADRNATSGAD